MRSEIIAPGVIHLQGTSQYEISSTFMRLQEFYESAQGLQGKYFEIEEMMDAYATNVHSKNFTYTTDWAGFNVPGNVVDEFFNTFDGYLTAKEAKLLEMLTTALDEEDGRENGKYYIIGTYNSCVEVSYYVMHEACHAFWYIDPEFKRNSMKIIRKLPKALRTTLNKHLIDGGYHKKVLDDETNAYLSTSSMADIRDDYLEDYDNKIPWDIIADLQANFFEYYADVTLLDD